MSLPPLGTLIALCAALPVAGVKTALAYRPRLVNASQLPLLYVRLPAPARSTLTLTYGQGLRTATLEVVIWSEFLNLNGQACNDALTVQLIDNLSAAIEQNAQKLWLDSYTITTDEDTIGDGAAPVQAILATMEVSG
jgi:hypothetical protein